MDDDDLTLTKFARAHRLKAAAVLVQIAEDESASPQSRQSAAEKILAYSDGKPVPSKPMTVADLASMPDALRQQLLEALLNHYQPEGYRRFVQETMKACIDDAMTQAALPKPTLQRGPKAQPAAPSAPPALEGGAEPIRARMSGEPQASPAQPPADPEPALYAPVIAGPPNVVQLPGTARADRPPSVSRIAPYEDDATPATNGTVHPSVVARSVFKDPLALDAAFNGFNSRRKRPW